MLQENEKVVMDDLRGHHKVSMEVNHSSNPDLKDTVKVSMEGNDAIIPIKDLYNFVFLIANAEQQEQLMPVKQTLVRKIVKIHKIKAKKDIRKGEYVNARCETNVPVEIWEGLKGMMDKRIVSRSIPLIGVK